MPTQNQKTQQDKYSRLVGTTLIFAISSFSSKILSFLIKPFVTNVLADPDVVGVTNLTTQFANLLLPLVSLGVAYGIVRFGLDKANKSEEVFTNGFFMIMLGYGFLWLLFPFIRLIPGVADYVFYLYIYVLTSCLRTLCTNFIRSEQRNKLVAIDGILCTFVTLMFYILFLVVFKWGASGYLLAVICADIFSSIFIFVYAKLWRKFSFKNLNLNLWWQMLCYSLPLVPAQISFWIINTSDLFFVQHLANGIDGKTGEYWVALLSTAYFLPLILNTLGIIFYNAWQISALTEDDKQSNFFAEIFSTYSGLLFCCAAGIIWLAQPLMFLFDEQFLPAWQFVPFLTIAAIFTCLNQFLGSIYVVYKRSMRSFLTMFAGAIANCLLNYVLILRFGVIGAAGASMLGMATVFILRATDTRQFLNLKMKKLKILLNLAFLLCESFILIFQVDFYYIYNAVITLAVIILNRDGIFMMLKLFLPKVLGKHGRKIVAKFDKKSSAPRKK